jgi:hypothetical protein
MEAPVRLAIGFVVVIAILAMLIFVRGVPVGPHPSHPIAEATTAETAAQLPTW